MYVIRIHMSVVVIHNQDELLMDALVKAHKGTNFTSSALLNLCSLLLTLK